MPDVGLVWRVCQGVRCTDDGDGRIVQCWSAELCRRRRDVHHARRQFLRCPELRPQHVKGEETGLFLAPLLPIGPQLDHSREPGPSGECVNILNTLFFKKKHFQLKGGDALLYQAFKLYKLSPELQWTAGGYVWPANTAIQFPTQDITSRHQSATNALFTARTPGFHVQRRGYGVPTCERSPRFFSQKLTPLIIQTATGGKHELVEAEVDILRAKIEETGGILLVDTGIQICTESEGSPNLPTPYGMPKPALPLTKVGTEHVYFVLAGELEKLVVNTLLVVYIP